VRAPGRHAEGVADERARDAQPDAAPTEGEYDLSGLRENRSRSDSSSSVARPDGSS
jgi:hypothetical protein